MKVKLTKGVAWTMENGKRKNVESIDVPTQSDCCKLDCCDNVIRFRDAAGDLQEISFTSIV